MVNRTGGSQTFVVHRQRMEASTGEDVDAVEFHKEFHTYTTQPGVFCDNKAGETHVLYEKEIEKVLIEEQLQAELSGSQATIELVKEKKSELYKKVAGVKKNKVRGLGSAVSDFFPAKSSSTTSSFAT